MDERNGMGKQSHSFRPRDEEIYTAEPIAPPSVFSTPHFGLLAGSLQFKMWSNMCLGMRYNCTQLRTTMNICEYRTRFPNGRFFLGFRAHIHQ